MIKVCLISLFTSISVLLSQQVSAQCKKNDYSNEFQSLDSKKLYQKFMTLKSEVEQYSIPDFLSARPFRYEHPFLCDRGGVQIHNFCDENGVFIKAFLDISFLGVDDRADVSVELIPGQAINTEEQQVEFANGEISITNKSDLTTDSYGFPRFGTITTYNIGFGQDGTLEDMNFSVFFSLGSIRVDNQCL